ncbi:FadR/GntR family transcriptional regulator [Lampropedia aestuarii]|uniref:FadR/GntR family transcriptional regulator n=1 Tax=Lampropedia aestuarii TaxID=2562762 RepID=UPI002469C004|nr:FadR/GntR family transcriptional regulator [Lampropedia aestuarii]MDH5857059.1 FadR/GntR family transcriptional regulator [Lampropedia aestuarii]
MRTSAVQHILDILKKEIQTSYKIGDILPNERELAERFGVGRNTVREAVIFLEAYQLVEKTQRGARVRKPSFEPMFHMVEDTFDASSKTAQDVLSFRRIVEFGCLSAVVQHATEDDFIAMDQANDRMDAARTVREAAQADHDFHAALLHSANNEVFSQLYRVMSQTLIYYLEIGKSNTAYNDVSSAQHRAIVQALRARSVAEAQSALRAHFTHSENVRKAENQ